MVNIFYLLVMHLACYLLRLFFLEPSPLRGSRKEKGVCGLYAAGVQPADTFLFTLQAAAGGKKHTTYLSISCT
jgi:hypothetical protein